jgi:hypothetical protein
MYKNGFRIIDALEPSEGMREKAKQKGRYRNYINAAIGEKPLDIPSGKINKTTIRSFNSY